MRVFRKLFSRPDLNLEERWWHKLFLVLFFLLFLYFILSNIAKYSRTDMFVGEGIQKWEKVGSLSERITSELKTPGALLKKEERLGEDGRIYVLNDPPDEIYYWVSNDVYCSTELYNNIEKIQTERGIKNLIIREVGGYDPVSLETFKNYIKQNNIKCLNVDGHGTLDFLEPNKSYQEGWSFYKKSDFKTVLYFAEMVLVITLLAFVIFFIIALIYYKLLVDLIIKMTCASKYSGRSSSGKSSNSTNVFAISLVIVFIIILGILFYWFSIRPSIIRKSCFEVNVKAYTSEEKNEARKIFDEENCSLALSYVHKESGRTSLKELGMEREQAERLFVGLSREDAGEKIKGVMENRKERCVSLEKIFNSPDEDWERPATDEEYLSCLRSNGLDVYGQTSSKEQLEDIQQTIEGQSEKIRRLEDNSISTKKENPSLDIQAVMKSAREKLDKENEARCQKELIEYNSCLSEYNSKLTEYNACLSESSDPNSWRYGMGSLCLKPPGYCFKPICAY